MSNSVNLAEHRARLVADAVVSAYVSEISRPRPPRRRAAREVRPGTPERRVSSAFSRSRGSAAALRGRLHPVR